MSKIEEGNVEYLIWNKKSKPLDIDYADLILWKLKKTERKAEGSDLDKANITKKEKLGGGKSFFFDELASLKGKDIKLVSNYFKKNSQDNGRVIIRNSTSVCITYNGLSLYDGDNADSKIRKGLAISSMRTILLYVDETMKLYFLDNTKEYLIKNLAWSAETHRPIKWILLRRLVFSESESDATVLKTDQYASLTNVWQESLNQC
ncbi:16814_t:CDS:2 [Rhizophagus irregularis]|nr:16814_t:CDS:2 [Rhizophagus irregularis]